MIVGYHGKISFGASIKINENFISGRNITRIFSLSYFQCKKYNGEIIGNTVVVPIGYRLKYICDGKFICWTH